MWNTNATDEENIPSGLHAESIREKRMRFVATPLADLWIIEQERSCDARGGFARTFCAAAFAEQGIAFVTRQCSVSYNYRLGTLRGIHFQRSPHSEAKLVRCTSGSVFDVAVDLRKTSPQYCRWFGQVLSAAAGNALFIPEGFGHGYITLEDNTELFYQIGQDYAPELAAGVRWNDPQFGIAWPMPPQVISERDANWPDFAP